ncbi:MAG: hypothetical protein IPF53_13245 [Blastocatellia bacterium]|mgnify:CR=1 FL=1|nr:hypothetical protein [Blastocatellia bacterium]MBK6425793.1 hypothetical protein [Blastocatellia bacterium]
MSAPRRLLTLWIATLAVVMAIVAIVAISGRLDRAQLAAVSGLEVVLMAVLVLPFAGVSAWRAANLFGPTDAGSAAWRMLAIGAIPLALGQVIGYLPSVLTLGEIEPVAVVCGQLLPASFRVLLSWALWRMLRAYRDTGIGFHGKTIDLVLMAVVFVITIVLFTRVDVLFSYWTANSELSETERLVMTSAQMVNFLLYPILLFLSLSMARFALQMGGGLVARAWGGVALYGLLQLVHVFVLAMYYKDAGPILSVAFDNFIVLAAFGALAMGPMFQVEAAEVRR